MITLYGELYSSKNSRQVVNVRGRTLVLKSKQCQRGEKEFAPQMEDLREDFLREIDNQLTQIKKPLKVGFKVYRKTHRRFDYQNILQGLSDLMVRYGWIPDDNADEFLPIYKEYEVDKENPRVEITIEN